MSVEVTFKPADLVGLVAEGTYLLDAARRMGVSIVTDCARDGTCKTCKVAIVSGASLLSDLTNAEVALRSRQELDTNQRLACQVTAERGGELVVEIIPFKKEEKAKSSKKFENPQREKLATIVQREIAIMMAGVEIVRTQSSLVGEKLLDKIGSLGKGREARADSKPKK